MLKSKILFLTCIASHADHDNVPEMYFAMGIYYMKNAPIIYTVTASQTERCILHTKKYLGSNILYSWDNIDS